MFSPHRYSGMASVLTVASGDGMTKAGTLPVVTAQCHATMSSRCTRIAAA